MAMTRHFVDVVVRELHWQPYIKGYWLDLCRNRGGAIITFKGHEAHEYKCSQKVATEIMERCLA